MKFTLAYYEATVHRFNHSSTRTPTSEFQSTLALSVELIIVIMLVILNDMQPQYLSLPPTRHDLTQGQKPEGRLKWG